MTDAYRMLLRMVAATTAAAVLILTTPAPAAAQNSPNTGALKLTAGLDFPSVYVFRGIVQETDPALTMFPYADLGWTLASGNGSVKSVGVNVGTWHSLQTGSSGSDGPSGRLHYEEDFYGTFSLGFGGGMSLAATFTAYTSPNNMFNSVTELSARVAKTGRIAPYGLVAFEFGGDDAGQADGGEKKGRYGEFGVAPAFALGQRLTLTVPTRIGLSLGNYYELGGEDHAFGFFAAGGLLTLPLTSTASRFGAWNVRGGVDFYTFGDTTEAFNEGESSKIVFGAGLNFSY